MTKGLSMRLTAEIADRGLDPTRLVEKFGVHAAKGPGGGDFLCIPYRRQGAIKNRKFRETMVPGKSGGKSWQDKQDKGAVRMLYNEDALRDASLKGLPVILTEGEPDLWALDQAGFSRIVGWPDGAPEISIPIEADSPKYKPLEDAMPLFSVDNLGGKDVPIIIAADGDDAGAVLLHDLSIRLGRARCKFLTYPILPDDKREEFGRARCKDLGEVLEFYGTAGVVKTIDRAQWVAAPGVYRMSELPPRAHPEVLDICVPGLNKSFRMRMGDWSVWTGIPGHGKTTLVTDLCCRVVDQYSTDSAPFVVTFASFEQDPQIDHKRNLLWWLGEQHPAKQTKEQLEYGEAWIDRHFRFLIPDEDADVSFEWLLEAAATSVVRDNAKVVVVDPWNEMDHVRDPGESVTDYTGRAIKAFRRFARKMGVHVMVVAHPTKMQQRVDGSFPIPTLYSISDSAHWFNKCDAGVIVHNFGDGRSLIWVQKTRYHDEIGVPEMYDAVFNRNDRRFEILGKHQRDAD